MNAKILLYLFTIYLVSYTVSENPLLVTKKHFDQIKRTAECVSKISAKYFIEKKALRGSIIIVNVNADIITDKKIILPILHAEIKYCIMIKNYLLHHANASHFPEKAKNYLLILEEKSELVKQLTLLSTLPTWNPMAKAIVFYHLEDNEDSEEMAIKFINDLLEYKFFKSYIVIYNELADEVVSYTWRPFSDNKCGVKCDSVYVLDRCKDNVVYQLAVPSVMFPLDMKGCPLVTYAVVSEPYVMPPISKKYNAVYSDAYDFQKGTEINLVKIISEFTNMSLILRKSDRDENWGTLDATGFATGAYGVLKNDSADLVIGNIEVTKIIRKWFHHTVSYTQDEMTWCVPKAGQAATWDNLVIIFQWTTWVATFVSLVMMGLLFHYLYYREHYKKVTKWPTNSLLMTFSMLVGSGAKFYPKSATFRILIFSWMCFSINMSISYESFLRSFLMHPRFEKQISSEADLIQSKIPLGGREIYRSYFETNNASSFYLYRKYNSTTFAKGIQMVALHRNFAIVSSRRQAEYQDQKLGRGAPLIYCFPESNNLYKYGVVLLARQWFPMLERFNGIIRSVSENGLIDKWNEELFIHTISEEGTSTIVPLSIQNLLGAFMFIGFMYAASVLVFIGELVFGFIEARNKKSSKFAPMIIQVRTLR